MVKELSVGLAADCVSNLETDSNQALYEQYLNWLQKPKIYVKIRVMPLDDAKNVNISSFFFSYNWYVFYSSELCILAIKNHPFLKHTTNQNIFVKHTFICDLSLWYMICWNQFLVYNIMHVLFIFLFFQDLLRTMPSNACFCNIQGTGIPRLRRVLRGLAWLYPDIGYCQGTGVVRILNLISLCIYIYKIILYLLFNVLHLILDV